jgi:hypothetical protein
MDKTDIAGEVIGELLVFIGKCVIFAAILSHFIKV